MPLGTTGFVARRDRPAITKPPDQPSSSSSMALLVASGGRRIAHVAGSRPAWIQARQSPCDRGLCDARRAIDRPVRPTCRAPAASPALASRALHNLGSTRLCRRTDAPRAYLEPVVRRTSARFRVSSIREEIRGLDRARARPFESDSAGLLAERRETSDRQAPSRSHGHGRRRPGTRVHAKHNSDPIRNGGSTGVRRGSLELGDKHAAGEGRADTCLRAGTGIRW
jgi:hypothetical protein